MSQNKLAFTLIELMVVVAVIAILATLSVTSFSAAIKRTRNAGRQADIQAVAKAMETCYDVVSGRYTGLQNYECGNENAQEEAFTEIVADLVDANCLTETIKTDMEDYEYVMDCQTGVPQKFVVCAELEKVANWGSVGNWSNGNNATPGVDDDLNAHPCDDDKTACYFCVKNQQ